LGEGRRAEARLSALKGRDTAHFPLERGGAGRSEKELIAAVRLKKITSMPQHAFIFFEQGGSSHEKVLGLVHGEPEGF
jgi:hypothetical protein